MTDSPKVCFDRILPGDLAQPLLRLGPGDEAIALPAKLWPNSSNLRVKFMGGSPQQRALAMQQAHWWAEHANLTFEESSAPDAEIRVTFDPSDGAWSYLGTDCLSIPRNEATMNLGFQDGGTSGHEFGHAIGFAHEHQNPAGGIEWDEPVVMRSLQGAPNFWTPDQIRHNVLDKYSVDQIRGTTFDADSIMLYFFPAEWTLNGIATRENEELSATDKAFAAALYPKPIAPVGPVGPVKLTVGAQPVAANIGQPGEEDLFTFVVDRPGRHVITTGGQTDLVMKLYGPNSWTALIEEDDDSGVGLNPRISRRLINGEYLVQIRHYNRQGGTGDYTLSVRR